MTDVQLLRGWGRTAPTAAAVLHPGSVDEVAAAVRAGGARGLLARGLGRSYGDAAQNAGGVVLDLRDLAGTGPIDPSTGEVTCGAGTSVAALLHRCLPQGWFVPVTPGTRHVTLGGALAADVHGKNHHRDGSFARHVTRVEVVDGRGERVELLPGDERLAAVAGGMGLAAVVTAITLRLLPVDSGWLAVDTVRTGCLDDTMSALHDADGRRQYSVAWLDCLATGARAGRGIVQSADHLPAAQAPRGADRAALPPQPRAARAPSIGGHLLGRRPLTVFNGAYHRVAGRPGRDVPRRVAPFFYPLDVVTDWNRLYGPAGFVQYQFVVPAAGDVARVLDVLRAARIPITLAVLKRFGASSGFPLSFPVPGWTLAADVPAAAPGLAAALDEADRLVATAGGRVYLAKDARVRPDVLAAMYPDLDRWRSARDVLDPHRVFASDLGRRIGL